MQKNARPEFTDHSLVQVNKDYGKTWAKRTPLTSLPPLLARANCPPEDAIEAYARNRLPECEVALLEEHLLVCHACQDALAGADTYLRALRVALADAAPVSEPPSAAPAPLRVRAHYAVWAALAAGLSLIGVLSPWWAQPRAEAAAVTLISMRGTAGASTPRAPAGVPLELRIDASHLQAGEGRRIEIVDSGGHLIWKGGAVGAPEGQLRASVPKRLGAGIYWVRLYGASEHLLQEFGLRVE
jgi:hypothetical protein